MFLIFSFAGFSGIAQESSIATLLRLQAGIDHYLVGSWQQALTEFHYVETETPSAGQKAEALYWIGLTELAVKNYEAALFSLEYLEAFSPEYMRNEEAFYHRGRALYSLGRYDDAIIQLGRYIEGLTSSINDIDNSADLSMAAALYWTGECLYSLGHFDRAEEIFTLIVNEYPSSYKYEASYYRAALISQKRVENELLALLGWTHEESLRNLEEYQRREHTYEQALIAYQRRISDMLKDTRLLDLETENAVFRQQLAASEERIRILEDELVLVQTEQVTSPVTGARENDSASRLVTLRASAVDLLNEILKVEGN